MDKSFTKKRILLIVISFLITAAVMAAVLIIYDYSQYGFNWDSFSATRVTRQYLNALTKKNITKAFDYVYLYEDDISNSYTGDISEAKKDWIDRVNGYIDNDTYLQSYSKLKLLNKDDNNEIYKLEVEFHIYDQAKQRIYMTVITVIKKDGSYKVASVSDDDPMDFYEYAISGNMK